MDRECHACHIRHPPTVDCGVGARQKAYQAKAASGNVIVVESRDGIVSKPNSHVTGRCPECASRDETIAALRARIAEMEGKSTALDKRKADDAIRAKAARQRKAAR